jgi:type IV secretion system protein VirD4
VAIQLGTTNGGPFAADLEDTVLVLGPPRVGKTTGPIASTILGASSSLICTSVRTDVLDFVVRRSTARCHHLDLGGDGTPNGADPVRWDLLGECREDTSPTARPHGGWERTGIITRAMMRAGGYDPSASGTDSYFQQRAERLLRCMFWLAANNNNSLADLLGWVSDGDCSALAKMSTQRPTTRRFVQQFLRSRPDELTDVFSTASNVLAVFEEPTVADCLSVPGGPSISLDDFFLRNESLVITCGDQLQSLVAPFITAFLAAAREHLFALNRMSKQAQSVWVLDEAANLAPLWDLPQIASLAGGSGLHLVACYQDLSQVRKIYGADLAAGFLTLFTMKIVFGGILDGDTLRILSEAAGEVWETVEQQQTNHRGLASGATQIPQRVSALSVGEIFALAPGTAIGIHRNRIDLVTVQVHRDLATRTTTVTRRSQPTAPPAQAPTTHPTTPKPPGSRVRF